MLGYRLGGKYLTHKLAIVFLVACSSQAIGQTATHYNAHPEIQMWSYPSGSANGAGAVRDRAPTFAAFSGIDEETLEPVFFQGSGLDPSRRGSFIIASDTSADIPTDLDTNRYKIDSLKITITVLGNLIFPPSFVLEYDNTLDDPLALTTGGGDDAGHPIEMYGIGLQGDYETISFDSTNDNALKLGDVRWRQLMEGEDGYDPELSPAEQAFGPYQFYALDANSNDVENSIVGGYSATDPSGVTSPFTPEPFAIGKIYDEIGDEIAPGTHIDYGDVFVFEPNLQNQQILEYLQQSLSEGHLGFSFSSMHQPAGHTGSVPYPDFYLDDLDVGNNPDGDAPTIEVSVTILDAIIEGDYDGNGTVDQFDYHLWVSQFGTAGPDADGNGDGTVDAGDYTIWRDNHESISSQTTAIAIPEPAGFSLVAILATAAFCGWVPWFTRSTPTIKE